MERFTLHLKHFQHFKNLLRNILLDELFVKSAPVLCWSMGLPVCEFGEESRLRTALCSPWLPVVVESACIPQPQGQYSCCVELYAWLNVSHVTWKLALSGLPHFG